jgi:hypothetical protein
MKRLMPILFVFACLPAYVGAEGYPAPLYSLSPDGTRVEYKWTAISRGEAKLSGTLRISSVGRKVVNGVPCRWVELCRETLLGDRTARHVRKALIREDAIGRHQPFADAVVDCLDMAPDGSVTKLSAPRTRDFLGLGIHGLTAELKDVADKEEVETKLGRFVTRHVSARGGDGARTLIYHAWLTDRVPFGWAKLEVQEIVGSEPARTIFNATAVKTAIDTKPELDETKVK